jgi:hypothetical protein
MTEKGLRKCRAVDGGGKPKPGFPPPPTSPWKSLPRFPHSRSPDYYRMEKWKSKSRIPTFPRSFFLLKIKTRKESQSSLLSSSFRLISGLENAAVEGSEKMVRPG